MAFIQFLVANFDSMDHIEVLIKSLRENHPGVSYELLVADQGSTDGSREYLESLPEVRLWKLEDRPLNTAFRDEMRRYVDELGLEKYMHPFFVKRTYEADNRKFHGEAMNFLVGKADARLCATLDTDMEFLGPTWFEPFLHYLVQGLSVVGTVQEEESIEVGSNFRLRTKKRNHPCLTFYRSAALKLKPWDFNFDPFFDLRMPLIHKSIVEKMPMSIVLGDMGHKVYERMENEGTGRVRMPESRFYRCVRHFNGATVRKDRKDELFLDWLKSVKHLPDLYEYAVRTYYYTSLNEDTLVKVKNYWSERDPALPRMPEVKLIEVD